MKWLLKFLRALLTADDVQHWIDKYEAAKRDNARLTAEVVRLRGALEQKRM